MLISPARFAHRVAGSHVKAANYSLGPPANTAKQTRQAEPVIDGLTIFLTWGHGGEGSARSPNIGERMTLKHEGP